MAAIDQAQVFGGHTAKIMVGNQEVGFTMDLSYSIDNGTQDVAVLGQVTVVEHQQTRYTVSGEFRKFKIRDLILNPQNDIVPSTAAEAIRKGVFDLDVVDKVTGKIVIRLENCTLTNNSSAVQTGQLVMQRVGFRALNTRVPSGTSSAGL